MRYTFVWLCLLGACTSPPKAPPTETQQNTTGLMNATLALTSVPGSSLAETQRAKDRLLARPDAMSTLMREFNRLPQDSVGRWHLIRLITTGAERGDQSAIRFLLREALVPDPRPSNNHGHGVASIDTPEETMVKVQAAKGLVSALAAHANGSAQAVNDLLHQSEGWLAKTVAMQMAHDRVMDQQYSSIMADRGLVSRFRDATDEETRARTTTRPVNSLSNAALPPRRSQ